MAKKKIDQTNVPEGKKLINDGALTELLARMDKLEAENKNLKAEQEAVADKARLQRFRKGIAPKNQPVVRLGVWGGKIIIGWDQMTKNRCEKNEQGRWIEELERVLILEDGERIPLPYLESVRHTEYVDATIIRQWPTGELLDKDGQPQVMMEVVTDDGKTLTIDARFVNP